VRVVYCGHRASGSPQSGPARVQVLLVRASCLRPGGKFGGMVPSPRWKISAVVHVSRLPGLLNLSSECRVPLNSLRVLGKSNLGAQVRWSGLQVPGKERNAEVPNPAFKLAHSALDRKRLRLSRPFNAALDSARLLFVRQWRIIRPC
jgi:hypothetical protein